MSDQADYAAIKSKADSDTAVADAAKATAEAETARANAAKAKFEADSAAAAARSAVAKAQADERTEADAASVGGQRERTATQKQKIADAKAAAASRQAQIEALIPDLGSVNRGSLDLKGDTPMFGSALSQRALEAVADLVAARLDLTGPSRVLVTSDAALTASDGVYHEVDSGLRQLLIAANDVLAEALSATPALEVRHTGRDERDTPRTATGREETLRATADDTKRFAPALAAPIAGALVKALPPVLSLLSAHRSLATSATQITDLTAATAVAGALVRRQVRPTAPGGTAAQPPTVLHDDVRLLKSGPLQEALDKLADARVSLSARKLTLARIKATAVAAMAKANDAAAVVTAAIAAATGEDVSELERQLATTHDAAAEQQLAASDADARAEPTDALIAAIDDFVVSLRAVPANGTLSPLTVAAMREQLHAGGNPPDKALFSHLLLVKGVNGSVIQDLEDRPLWAKDRFAVVATASIAFLLLDTVDSHIISGGTLSASVSGAGKIGEKITFSVDQ